jgi:hypothetical protein
MEREKRKEKEKVEDGVENDDCRNKEEGKK